MEVHAHSHTARKKWTHYFWEFLMLFLAVFCGFLAENFREHKVENHRAKVYAHNLFKELKKDTTNIDTIIKDINLLTGRLDTFCLYARRYPGPDVPTGTLYYYASFTTWIKFYTSDNTTINQLKSSGNLRLLPDDITQSINEYGKRLADLDNEYALTKAEFLKIEELYFKIFDNNLTPQLLSNPKNIIQDSIFKLNVPLIETDPKIMKEFSGWLRFELNIYREQVSDHLLPLKAKAIELLAQLKNKYHFD